MNLLIILASIAVIISFIKDRKKTLIAIKKAVKQFFNIIIPVLVMLIMVSLALYLIPDNFILKYLSNENKYIGMLIASFLGSVSIMPGFIAFPLSGILKQNDVSYMVISAFTTTLMMVGILTFPVENKYFGVKVAILRNIISFFIAIIIALVTGIFFGEIF